MTQPDAELARLLHDFGARLESLERTGILSRSTIPGSDGAPMPLVPAVQAGVGASVEIPGLRDDLAAAAALIASTRTELEAQLADAELGLEGAGARLTEAEGLLADAFGRLDTDVPAAIEAARASAVSTASAAAATDAQTKATAARIAAIEAAEALAIAKANGAQSAAIATAETKAQQLASAAEAAAKTAAAADAKSKADAAQAAAISAAATDATTKANNARTSAVSTAASDATTKANNARTAAITAAATDAKAQAEAAEARAAATAAADAKSKADAAQAAAISAAAETAQLKANGAQSAAIAAAETKARELATAAESAAKAAAAADAKSKADAAQAAATAAAATDAKSKADAAQAAAIAAAAADATSKANAAQAAAAQDATDKANAARTAALAEAEAAKTAAAAADRRALDALGIAQGKGAVYRQPEPPVPVDVFGLWLDTDDGNKPYAGQPGARVTDEFEGSTVLTSTGTSSRWALDASAGRTGGGLTHDASTAHDMIVDPSSSFSRTAGYTVEAWVNVSAGTVLGGLHVCAGLTGTSGYQVLVDARGASSGGSAAFQIRESAGTTPLAASGLPGGSVAARWIRLVAIVTADTITARAFNEAGLQIGELVATSTTRTGSQVGLYGYGPVRLDGFRVEGAPTWQPVQDQAIAAAAATATSAATAAAAADRKATDASTAAATAQGRANDAHALAGNAGDHAQFAMTAAATADGKAVTAQQNAATADGKAVTAQQAAATADGKAVTAQQAASTADDKAVTAQQAAATADSKAVTADGKAVAAQTTANTANTQAGRPRVLYSTAAPSGSALQHTIWRRINGSGDVIGEWRQTAGSATTVGSTWAAVNYGDEILRALDVGKLTAGMAAIASVVAQKIAGATAQFQQADVGNLFVTGTSTLTEAVIQKLWADVVRARLLTVTEQIIAPAAIIEDFAGHTIRGASIEGVDITGTSSITGARYTSRPEASTRVEIVQDRMDFYSAANVRAGSMFGIQYASIEHLIGLGVPSTEATPLPYFGATFGKMSHQVAGAARDVGFYTNNAAIGGNLYSYGDIFARNLRDTENGLLLQAPIVGTTAQRNARHWTSSAEFRKLLADANVQWFNTDTKCLEQYFISVADGGVAGKGAVTVSGWYPIAGNLPAGRAWKSGGAHSFGFPNDNTLIGTGNVLWQTGVTYQQNVDSWVLPHAGRYRIASNQMFSSANGNVTQTLRNHDTGEAYLVVYARPAGNHFQGFPLETEEVLPAGARIRASVAGSSINAVCERNTWHVGIEYLGPPFV